MQIMLVKFGSKLPLKALVEGVLRMDLAVLGEDPLGACEALAKFVPTEEEAAVLAAYTGPVGALGRCEQYFVEVLAVPRFDRKLAAARFNFYYAAHIKELREGLDLVGRALATHVDVNQRVGAHVYVRRALIGVWLLRFWLFCLLVPSHDEHVIPESGTLFSEHACLCC